MFGIEGDSLLWFLIIGIAAGWLAGQVTHGGGFGLVGDLVVGVVGAFVGRYLANLLGCMPMDRLVPLLRLQWGRLSC